MTIAIGIAALAALGGFILWGLRHVLDDEGVQSLMAEDSAL